MPMEIHDDKIIMRAGKYNLQTPWQGLTHEEVEEVWEQVESSDFLDCVHPLARAIEAKLKEKNHG